MSNKEIVFSPLAQQIFEGGRLILNETHYNLIKVGAKL